MGMVGCRVVKQENKENGEVRFRANGLCYTYVLDVVLAVTKEDALGNPLEITLEGKERILGIPLTDTMIVMTSPKGQEVVGEKFYLRKDAKGEVWLNVRIADDDLKKSDGGLF